MDTVQWPQEVVVKPIDEISRERERGGQGNNKIDKKRAQKEHAVDVNCPRCNSTNTKFCYYNNYSLTQPRYFCKTCRRYWTEGGSLRNIPVGGGSRKNKRSSSSSSSRSTDDKCPPPPTSQKPKIQEVQDLNLGFPLGFRTFSEYIQAPDINIINNNKNDNMMASCSTSSTITTTAAATITNGHQQQQVSALELLTGMSTDGNNNSFTFIPQDPISNLGVYTTLSGFNIPMQDFKPTLGFSLDGFGYDNAYANGDSSSNGRLLFPFQDLKLPVSSTTASATDIDQQINREGGDKNSNNNSGGYWTGMLGGGSW